ncbi:alpha-glycosidase [Paenactinomyces guangxiensis]|uniref:Alpha-glycosidase n=1 Tax=Paenactinomyces guangxiensis TaxID=1490290 RepID=A0A7W2A7L0_9BACL|nr:alpha-glycosidase [Paenactinomyces guangxiensis]MBA4493234.1 alpha-glycosidase [Paenactinomyces guangxiensis]MBH8589916.1 alpha-glycosidase [Paenactinomyces guangxiensis]
MIQEAIFHRTGGAFAYPLSPHQLRVRLRAKKGDLAMCRVWYADRYSGEDEPGTWADCEKTASDELFDYFEGRIDSQTGRIKYVFRLEDTIGEKAWFGETGFAAMKKDAGVFQYAYIHPSEVFQTPDWANEAVVYQIFPERFHNGDKSNDPERTEPWTPDARPRADSFYGGDLQGVIERLPYLEQLGVTSIYFTPIFLSPSHHKYDTADYYQIDPQFGELSTFKQLVQEAHRRGIKVILDAVFNHAGDQFFAFQDVLKHGERSRYKDWFYLHSFPVVQEPKPNYETFANQVPAMPKLKTENPEVRRYLLEVVRYWMEETGIDGWRLDVANEVDHRFWRDFRELVKEINPAALIIGEIWHDSSAWLEGDEFDSVMNYLFRESVLRFFATGKIDAGQFDAELTRSRMIYKEQAVRVLWNLLDSHDTERFLTSCSGAEEKFRLAVLFQFTYIGTPLIYYGDEIGMEGKTDPDCRRPMIWEESCHNKELLAYYRRLISIRRSSPALCRGNVHTWYVDANAGIYAFVRQYEQEVVGVVFNNSDQQRTVCLDTSPFGTSATELEDLLQGDKFPVNQYKGVFQLAPYQGMILRGTFGSV